MVEPTPPTGETLNGTASLPFPWPYAFLVAAVLTAFTVFQGAIPYMFSGEPFPWYFRAVPVVTGNLLWALLCPLIHRVVRGAAGSSGARVRTVAGQLGISLAFATVHRVVAEGIFLSRYYFEDPSGFGEFLAHVAPRVPVGTVSSFIEYWIIVGAFYAFDFYHKYKDKQLELAVKERELSDAQLGALRMQLHPHFLFNTLHTASSLMDEDVRRAREVLSRLGSLLRRLLDSDRDHLVPLERELEFARDYLDIEQERFQDRLRVEYDVEDDVLEVPVPNLVLQPLLENAVKHGFSRRTEGGSITVRCRRRGDELEIVVRDDGSGATDAAAALRRPGIGIGNVRDRLRQLYGERHSFRVDSPEDGGFEVRIRIPADGSREGSA